MATTVLFLLDALRHDYLSKENTPFLCQCANAGQYWKHVVPGLSFCERSEIFSGLEAGETGFFTAIGYDPENSPYKDLPEIRFLQFIDRVFQKAGTSDRSNRITFPSRVIRYLVRTAVRRLRNISMPVFHIPIDLLPFFSLTEDRTPHWQTSAFPKPSILESLISANRRFFYDSFTALGQTYGHLTDEQRMGAAAKAISEDYDLVLVYCSELDSVGHSYGPDSHMMQKALKTMDSQIENFVRETESDGDVRYIFLGDHGMVPVSKYINISEDVIWPMQEKGYRIKEDFIFFLDSNMLRVWCNKSDTAAEILESLKAHPLLREHGTIVDATYARKKRIPWNDRRYGDFLWIADPGSVVHPDFFHSKEKCKGMHGYDPDSPESHGMCIMYGNDVSAAKNDSMRLTDVYGLLRESLSV